MKTTINFSIVVRDPEAFKKSVLQITSEARKIAERAAKKGA